MFAINIGVQSKLFFHHICPKLLPCYLVPTSKLRLRVVWLRNGPQRTGGRESNLAPVPHGTSLRFTPQLPSGGLCFTGIPFLKTSSVFFAC